MKRNILFSLIILSLSSFIFNSCKDDAVKSDLSVNFNAKFENNDLVMSQAYTDPLGNQIRYTTFKFYISDLVLIKEDDSRVEISDIELVDFEAGSTFTINSEIEEGVYKAVEFGLGVSPDLNQKDPSMFPNDHPLSSFTNTFWSWASKYRFALIEGDVDTNSTGTFPIGFVYHTGLDTLYRVRNIATNLVANGGAKGININVQTADIFFKPGEEIDYVLDNISHTVDNMSLAERVTENLLLSIN